MSVTKLAPGVLLSLSAIAGELGTARETLRNRLKEASVAPAGESRGHPLYRLRDVLAAWSGPGRFDPDSLPPFQRAAHFQAEQRKLALEIERGELIPAMECERTYALMLSVCTQAFDVAVDFVERDVGITPAQAARLEKHFDEIREQTYQKLVNLEIEPEFLPTHLLAEAKKAIALERGDTADGR